MSRCYPPFRTRLFEKAYDLTGYSQAPNSATEAALYEHALGFLDRFIDEAAERGLTLRHRLDAQSVVWGVLSESDEKPPIDVEPESEPFESAQHVPDLPDACGGSIHASRIPGEESTSYWRRRSRSSSRGRRARGRLSWRRNLAEMPCRVRRTGSHWCSSTRPTPTRTSCRASVRWQRGQRSSRFRVAGRAATKGCGTREAVSRKRVTSWLSTR